MGLLLELPRRQPNLTSQHLQMPQPTLKTAVTAIILPSHANEPDARMKGTKKLMDHIKEESVRETCQEVLIVFLYLVVFDL